ncbi:ATP-binding protein [Streptomyces longwoodensis]|uniref:ATP-binding protein n=1 Tax=Streptomyces longwoodensis TaxID=68231 RepID=UPI0033FBF662
MRSTAQEQLVCEFSVRCEREAIPASREIVRRRLSCWDCDGEAMETACLVVSELVTNAAMHSGGTRVDVRMQWSAETLRIQVRDDGRWHPSVETPQGELTECGRGLAIVTACASEHGRSTSAAGTTSWAVIPAP